MTARRRVAITGIGLVTPAGLDAASTWNRLKAAQSCAAPITVFDASGFSTRIAAEAAAAPVRLVRITNVKVRSFTPPGATLTLSAERVDSAAGTDVVVKVGAQVEGGEGRAVAAARMIFAPASEGSA